MSAPRAAVRLGAVEYLNARPLVFGLDRNPAFELRFDVPSRCADLLHAGVIDVGLIPSIEYLRATPTGAYRIVPGLAIGSRGPVASVVLYTIKPLSDVQSLALDVSSRASVALVQVLCAHRFVIRPSLETQGPDLASMLTRCDAALVIGDTALFLDTDALAHVAADVAERRQWQPGRVVIEPLDLGRVWTEWTGLPFVYAFWAGTPGALDGGALAALRTARDLGVTRPRQIANEYFKGQPGREEAGERYLRDNIRYGLGEEERAGLERFYRYAAEAGVVSDAGPLRFYDEHPAAAAP